MVDALEMNGTIRSMTFFSGNCIGPHMERALEATGRRNGIKGSMYRPQMHNISSQVFLFDDRARVLKRGKSQCMNGS